MKCFWLVVVSCGACSVGAKTTAVAEPNQPLFNEVVLPVLLRDCAFSECHGNHERFFQVFGPRRARYNPLFDIEAPMTQEEREVNYDRARGMITGAQAPDDALLLRKPLAVSQGGAYHKGLDELGRDVYMTKDAQGYQVLRQWVATAYDEPQP